MNVAVQIRVALFLLIISWPQHLLAQTSLSDTQIQEKNVLKDINFEADTFRNQGFKDFSIGKGNEAIPVESDPKLVRNRILEADEIAETRTMMLLLREDTLQGSETSARQILSALLKKYDLRLIKTLEEIDTIIVSYDIKKFSEEIGFETPKNKLKRVGETINTFTADPVIIAASPDVALKSNLIGSSIGDLTVRTSTKNINKIDWSVKYADIPELWKNKNAYLGRIIGIVDQGFHAHEDIPFYKPQKNTAPNDHGNHAAGVACAKHNKFGTYGILPICLVRPIRGIEFDFEHADSWEDEVNDQFNLIFQSLYNMQLNKDDVDTLSISLGYNWSKFGIDGRNNPDALKILENQGAFAATLMKQAAKRNTFFFSAAGNDSTVYKSQDAYYSSPFNYAIIKAKAKNPKVNGAIILANDDHGKKPGFSNVNGDLSCPGVDIFSTVAKYDDKPVNNAYGSMSGTSMATPFCAAAFELLSLLLPDHSKYQILYCMKHSGVTHGFAPVFNAKSAFDYCEAIPPETL